jgi:hypothetical protein
MAELLRVLAPIIAPFVALGGAIHLFYKKQASDRVDAMRTERRNLYSRFLSQANEIWNLATDGPNATGLAAELIRLGATRNELRILAPKKVYDSSAAFSLALNELCAAVVRQNPKDWPEFVSNLKQSHLEKIAKAEFDLVVSMRDDLETSMAISAKKAKKP